MDAQPHQVVLLLRHPIIPSEARKIVQQKLLCTSRHLSGSTPAVRCFAQFCAKITRRIMTVNRPKVCEGEQRAELLRNAKCLSSSPCATSAWVSRRAVRLGDQKCFLQVSHIAPPSERGTCLALRHYFCCRRSQIKRSRCLTSAAAVIEGVECRRREISPWSCDSFTAKQRSALCTPAHLVFLIETFRSDTQQRTFRRNKKPPQHVGRHV